MGTSGHFGCGEYNLDEIFLKQANLRKTFLLILRMLIQQMALVSLIPLFQKKNNEKTHPPPKPSKQPPQTNLKTLFFLRHKCVRLCRFIWSRFHTLSGTVKSYPLSKFFICCHWRYTVHSCVIFQILNKPSSVVCSLGWLARLYERPCSFRAFCVL